MNPSGHASPSAIYAVIFTFTALAILAVALRIYTRRVILRKLEQDDVLMFVALLCACCFTVCQALESEWTTRRSQEDFRLSLLLQRTTD